LGFFLTFGGFPVAIAARTAASKPKPASEIRPDESFLDRFFGLDDFNSFDIASFIPELLPLTNHSDCEPCPKAVANK
jgi:hypothetical protein